MPNVTVDEAKSDFDRVLAEARNDPVLVFADHGPTVVVLSWDAFKRVMGRSQARHDSSRIVGLLDNAIGKRREGFEALSKLD